MFDDFAVQGAEVKFLIPFVSSHVAVRRIRYKSYSAQTPLVLHAIQFQNEFKVNIAI